MEFGMEKKEEEKPKKKIRYMPNKFLKRVLKHFDKNY